MDARSWAGRVGKNERPVLCWLKVTDLEPGVIEAF
jgi:hypothetical protein